MINDSGIVLNRLNNALLATIQATLMPEVLQQFKGSLLNELVETKVKYILCDLSAVDIIDIEEFSSLSSILDMAGLMGAKTIFIGMPPNIAATIVDYDIDINKFQYALTIDEGLSLAQ